jgi:hypothetical protein
MREEPRQPAGCAVGLYSDQLAPRKTENTEPERWPSPACLQLLFSAPQNSGDHPGASAAVNNGKDEKWVFIRRICNQKIAHTQESHGPCSQVGAAVSLMGKRNEVLNGLVNLFSHPVGGVLIISRDEFSKLVKIDVRLGMQNVAAHARLLRRASLFSRNRANASSPSMGFTRPLLMSS